MIVFIASVIFEAYIQNDFGGKEVGVKWVWFPCRRGLNTHIRSTNTLPFQMCDGGRLNDLFLKISCATSVSSVGEILDEDDEYIV